LHISASVSQTRSSFATLKPIEEGGHGEIIKFTTYLQSLMLLLQENPDVNSILDLKLGVCAFGISNGNGVYRPMYFFSFGFGFYKNFKNK